MKAEKNLDHATPGVSTASLLVYSFLVGKHLCICALCGVCEGLY